MIKAFEAVLGEKIPHVFEERREGDVAECFTETSLARDVIGFQADKDINDMVSSALNFAKNYSA